MSRDNFNHRKQSGKLKCPDDDSDDEAEHPNPTNLELIDLRAALLFNDTRLLAFNREGQIVFIDKQSDDLETLADHKNYRWDWQVKLAHPVFKNMFWLGCDNTTVQVDSANHGLKLVISNDLRPAIMMVEPWSGHLHVYDHNLSRTDEQWLKLCDVRGTVMLIPPSSYLLRDPDIRPMTLTGMSFCTRDPKLTFSKKVKKISDALGEAVLNDVVPQHSNVHAMD